MTTRAQISVALFCVRLRNRAFAADRAHFDSAGEKQTSGSELAFYSAEHRGIGHHHKNPRKPRPQISHNVLYHVALTSSILWPHARRLCCQYIHATLARGLRIGGIRLPVHCSAAALWLRGSATREWWAACRAECPPRQDAPVPCVMPDGSQLPQGDQASQQSLILALCRCSSPDGNVSAVVGCRAHRGEYARISVQTSSSRTCRTW